MSRKNRFYFITLIFIFCILFPVYSDTFYLNNFSARVTGMGEAFTSIPYSPDILFINPAMLSLIKKNCFEYNYANLFNLDIIMNSFWFTAKLKKGGIGIGYTIISSGEQPVTDVRRYTVSGGQTGEGMVFNINEEPVILGYFSESRTALYLGYGFNIYENIYTGWVVKRYAFYYEGDTIEDKYINALIHTKANCWGVDIGFFIHKIYNLFNFGIKFGDFISTGFKWNTEFPYVQYVDKTITAGISSDIIENLIAGVDITYNLAQKEIEARIGAEYILLETVFIRGGYKKSNINFGTGIILSHYVMKYLLHPDDKELLKYNFNIGYTGNYNLHLGITHRFSFLLKW